MMVEASLEKGKKVDPKPAKWAPREPSPSSSKKGKKKAKKPPTVIQRLYDTCKEVFAEADTDAAAGAVPSPQDVDRIRSILDTMIPADVGLTPKLPFYANLESTGVPPITYLHVYECPKFSIGIFCLPPSGVIPLHNHPGMTVFSKLLVGSMHIKSYDWVDDPRSSNDTTGASISQLPGKRLAKMNKNAVFTAPCETSILYPTTGGNLHCFTGQTACAVLDVLGPPYDDSKGRHCAYYNNYPYESFSGDAGAAASVVPSERNEYAWLEERPKPNDFFVVGAKYKGPKIVEN